MGTREAWNTKAERCTPGTICGMMKIVMDGLYRGVPNS